MLQPYQTNRGETMALLIGVVAMVASICVEKAQDALIAQQRRTPLT